MNPYYEEIMALKEADEFKTVIERWRILSENIRQFPTNAPILLPDMLWNAPSGVGKTNLLHLMCEYQASKKNLMDFYGDVKFFEFLLSYCPPNAPFSELPRLMEAVRDAGGFRSEYRGVMHINVCEWLDHYEEPHFVSLMEYLAANSDKWLIVLSLYTEDEEKLHNFAAFLSMYLRLERVTLSLPGTPDLLTYVESIFAQYGLTVEEDARQLLTATIDTVRRNRYFDGFKTIKMLCQDIVYAVFSHNKCTDRLTAAMLTDFAPDSEYVRRRVASIERINRIGFGV